MLREVLWEVLREVPRCRVYSLGNLTYGLRWMIDVLELYLGFWGSFRNGPRNSRL